MKVTFAIYRNNKKGFTLTELIIVVAIIAALASIAIPTLENYRNKAFNASAQSDIKNAKTAIEMYKSDKMNYPY